MTIVDALELAGVALILAIAAGLTLVIVAAAVVAVRRRL